MCFSLSCFVVLLFFVSIGTTFLGKKVLFRHIRLNCTFIKNLFIVLQALTHRNFLFTSFFVSISVALCLSGLQSDNVFSLVIECLKKSHWYHKLSCWAIIYICFFLLYIKSHYRAIFHDAKSSSFQFIFPSPTKEPTKFNLMCHKINDFNYVNLIVVQNGFSPINGNGTNSAIERCRPKGSGEGRFHLFLTRAFTCISFGFDN